MGARSRLSKCEPKILYDEGKDIYGKSDVLRLNYASLEIATACRTQPSSGAGKQGSGILTR
jgi:hypothetical protein